MGQTLRPKQHTWLLQHFHKLGTRPDCRAGLPRDWFGAVAVPRLLGPQGPGCILHQHHPFPPLHRAGFLVIFRSLSHPTLAQRGDGSMDQQTPATATAVLAMSTASMSCPWGTFPATSLNPYSCHLHVGKHQDQAHNKLKTHLVLCAQVSQLHLEFKFFLPPGHKELSHTEGFPAGTLGTNCR